MSHFATSLSPLKWVIYGIFLALFPLFFWQIATFWPIHPESSTGKAVPYGYRYFSGDDYSQQDFAYNLNFFSQIWHQTTSRPYRIADQEEIVRNWNPSLTYGMAHGYSPVGLCLAWPFLFIAAWQAYLLYIFLILVELLALVRLYLLPRASNPFQVLLLIPAILNLSYLTALYMGQSSLFTTGVFAAIWLLLQKRSQSYLQVGHNFALAILLWMLCAKPNLGLVAVCLALGCRAWLSVFFLGGLLILTWVGVENLYGGWWIGLQDYSYLLSHYHQAALTPFFQPGSPVGQGVTLNAFLLSFFPQDENLFFFLNRYLFTGLCFFATGLCWQGTFTRSELFQALIWILLICSPYLLATEDWLICLLVIESNFFRPAHFMILKLLLLLLAVNERLPTVLANQLNESGFAGGAFDYSLYCRLAFLAKALLCLWWLLELLANKLPPFLTKFLFRRPEPDAFA